MCLKCSFSTAVTLFLSRLVVLSLQYLHESYERSKKTSSALVKTSYGSAFAQLVLLALSSVEVALALEYHPLMKKTKFGQLADCPRGVDLVVQVLAFFLFDILVYWLFERYYPLFSLDREGATAAYIATDFTMIRATVLLGITVIQAFIWAGIIPQTKQVHFLGVAGWLWIRQSYGVYHGALML